MPSPPAKCRFPIILLHGLFGFVERRLGPFRLTYYRGVVPYLESVGNRVVALKVSPSGSIAHRASQICNALNEDPLLSDTPLNLIGHSMGGLDARYLITELGFGDRVKSLTTLSTPHRGSLLADLVDWIPGVRRLVPAIPDLTEKNAPGFNERTPDVSATAYFSVPASTPFLSCCPIMWPTYLLIRALRGPNDGQVSVASARWGEVLEVADTDHLELVGMRYGLNLFREDRHLDLFGRITRVLAEKGF